MRQNKSIAYLIALISIAMFALLWIQYVLIRNSIERTNEDLNRKVSTLLTEMVKEVENNNYCVGFFSKIEIPSDRRFGLVVMEDSVHSEAYLPFYYYNKSFADSLMRFDSIRFDVPVEMHMTLNVEFLSDEIPKANSHIEDINTFKEKFEDKIFKMSLLDSLLEKNFKQHHIDQPYEYAIRDPETKEVLFASTDIAQEEIFSEGIMVPVFKRNKYYQSYELFLAFPDKYFAAIQNNMLLILSSALVLLVFAVILITFFRMLFKERKLSEMKIDFVNNITHEFKTPISNIKLAANALRKTIPESDQQLLGIIEEENERLHQGMDLVLTTALLEKEELLLDKKPIDLIPVMEKLVVQHRLAVEKQGGSIRLDSIAAKILVSVDELHFKNMISSLLDNALKYADKTPEICIRLYTDNDKLVVVVQDNGMGIHHKDLPYIFDRFYRVSTQNRHETYGYGIGLSYVKMIVEGHEGKIDVTSKPEVGSTFKITLAV